MGPPHPSGTSRYSLCNIFIPPPSVNSKSSFAPAEASKPYEAQNDSTGISVVSKFTEKNKQMIHFTCFCICSCYRIRSYNLGNFI